MSIFKFCEKIILCAKITLSLNKSVLKLSFEQTTGFSFS